MVWSGGARFGFCEARLGRAWCGYSWCDLERFGFTYGRVGQELVGRGMAELGLGLVRRGKPRRGQVGFG